MSRPLRIGTRGSALARAQASLVADMLGGAELVTIATSGDRGAGAQDKSRWVDAIEAALQDGEVDLAVHSAKDVPGQLGDGLVLVGAPPRADPRDALCGAPSLDGLAEGARVGTSSLRRRAALLALRGDLEVVALRGNVDTRLRKLAEGETDAVVLARAGLDRLGRAEAAGGMLEIDAMVPAPGQGTLALEARVGDGRAREAGERIGDARTMACLRAERALVEALDATCHTPVGAHARLSGDAMEIHAFVGLPDGSGWARDELTGATADPERLGLECAQRLLAAGAGELLRRAETLTRSAEG
ncbi:MAG: hydroxymethylbilane synthase [Solirubrobacteraceae bacterium]